MSKSLAPIIKKYNAKRLKKDNPYAPQRIQFNSNRDATTAVWEINYATGRECYNDGNIVNVYR
jgi:hypothetical protein